MGYFEDYADAIAGITTALEDPAESMGQRVCDVRTAISDLVAVAKVFNGSLLLRLSQKLEAASDASVDVMSCPCSNSEWQEYHLFILGMLVMITDVYDYLRPQVEDEQ